MSKNNLTAWSTNAQWVFDSTEPFTAADEGKWLRIDPAVNWTPGYQVVRFVLEGFDLGAQGVQNIAFLYDTLTAGGIASGKASFVTNQTNRLVADGNSFLQYPNPGGDTNNYQRREWMKRTQYLLGPTWEVINLGVSGQTTAQMLSDESSQVLPLYDATKARNVLFAFEGINDLFYGASVATAYANLKAYGQAGVGAGFETWLCTGTPRQETGTPADYASKLAALNAMLRADFGAATNLPLVKGRSAGVTYAHRLVDVGALPEFADPTSAFYFEPDKVHLNLSGFDRAATLLAPVASSIVVPAPAFVNL